MKRWLTEVAAMAVALGIVAGVYIYSGLYNIGADVPHWSATSAIIETARERSIAHHAKDLQVPNLEDPQLILKGAGQYDAMCVSCHLAPGIQDSELRPGLYPRPPLLSKYRVDPRRAFWVIKHGIKMSAMPAWGLGHDDATIWSMVAFINKLPDMTPQQYQDTVTQAPPDEEMQHGASHAHHMDEEPAAHQHMPLKN